MEVHSFLLSALMLFRILRSGIYFLNFAFSVNFAFLVTFTFLLMFAFLVTCSPWYGAPVNSDQKSKSYLRSKGCKGSKFQNAIIQWIAKVGTQYSRRAKRGEQKCMNHNFYARAAHGHKRAKSKPSILNKTKTIESFEKIPGYSYFCARQLVHT